MKDRDVYFKFFPNDWRGDAELRNCSLAARGLWLELMCLAHRFDGYVLINGAPPTMKLLARQVGCAEGELRRHLEELQREGVCSTRDDGVIFSRRMVRDAHRRKANRENGLRGGNPRLTVRISESDNRMSESRITESVKTHSHSHNHSHSPESDKSDQPPSPFERFWTAYPRRTAKGAALKAFAKLNPDDATVEAILSALEWQRVQPDWLKDGGKFVPYPATYLNQRRWEDERPVVARRTTPDPDATAAFIQQVRGEIRH